MKKEDSRRPGLGRGLVLSLFFAVGWIVSAGIASEMAKPNVILILTEGEHSIPRIENQRFVERTPVGQPEEGRKDIAAVFGGMVRERRPGDCRARREEIDQGNRDRRHGPGLDLSRPSGDERNPMAAFPNSRLIPAEVAFDAGAGKRLKRVSGARS